MPFVAPETFNIADYFLDARIREGAADRPAVLSDAGSASYREIQQRSERFGQLLRQSGIQPEQRVIIALPDGPDFVAALFGILKIGAVVVMVNPGLTPEAIRYFYDYTEARAVIHNGEACATFEEAARQSRNRPLPIVADDPTVQSELERMSRKLETFPSHRDDPAIWLFSGGTTGQPKAVVQTHRSFANTTECYAKGVIGYRSDDVTLSVPKLYFGYATGSNLLFPFAVGGCTALFPERCTAEELFSRIALWRPTILINVPTMVNHMVNHPTAKEQDLSSLRLATSAGEALPVDLYHQWRELFGVELLDGLGTAEMWHIFISNRPGSSRAGSLGQVVPGFEVRVRDAEGREVPDGEVGALWVRGDSRASGYWRNMEKTCQAFRGEWYVSGDMVRRDTDGYFWYGGRADDMLKVGGKWLSPGEVENCLLSHPSVSDAAVVGITDDSGLTKPHAFVVAEQPSDALAEELKKYVTERLEPYKHPRKVVFMEQLPRTHLGKVDRGLLRSETR